MNQNELYHHGIKGMHWGIRRYQNPDGTLTAKGKQRYGTVENFNAARAQRRKNIVKGAAIGAGIAGAGLAAYYGGKAAWKNPAIRNKLTSMYQNTANTATNAYGKAKDWTTNAAKDTANWASNAAKNTANAATNAYGKAKDFANNAVGDAKNWARRQVRQGQLTYKYGTDFAGNSVGETVGRAARNVTTAAGKAAGAVSKGVGAAKEWTNNAVGDAKDWAGKTYAKTVRTAKNVKGGIGNGYLHGGNIPDAVKQRYAGLGAGVAVGKAARGAVGAAQTAYRATGKAARAAGQWAYANRGNIARGAGVVAGGTALGAGVGAIARNNQNRKKKK